MVEKMNNIGHTLFNKFTNIVGSVKGAMKESKFYTEGKLTPEEYIQAGDFLVQKCPTWKWCAAKEGHVNSNLPKDKQYLKTTVPCPRRAVDYFNSNQTKEKVVDGDWVEADLADSAKKENKKEKKIVDLDDDDDDDTKKDKVVVGGDKVVDLDDDEGDKAEEAKKEEKTDFDDFCIVEDDKKNVLQTRTYDVTVTYDFYYCVPRMWLMGYSEEGVPLNDSEMKQDIMMEYRNQTVTIDPHPCTGVRNISVHPCRHSLLLKKMIENFEKSGKKLDIEMSILIFLKFVHSAVPTIQYDFTMDINF